MRRSATRDKRTSLDSRRNAAHGADPLSMTV